MSTRDLISEGMTRIHRWVQLASQLPPLQSIVSMNGEAPGAELTDEESGLLQSVRRHASKRIIDLVEESQSDDLRTLTVFKNLYEWHIVKVLPWTDQTAQNGDHFSTLKASRRYGRAVNDFMGDAFQTVLKKPDDTQPRQHERRRNERRFQDDRRKYDRRRDSSSKEKTRVYLNKSELLLIRNKLIQATEGRQR
jgi:hypothetical protein